MNGVQMRAILVLLGIMVLAPLASADERVDRLPEEHKAWLEREVVYIIAKREREVFLMVESVEERNRFIEAFWRKRDPNPATLDNEYKIEHYRRIDYANTYLGRETFREGWRTDRGRYYILLGEPREIQRFDGYGQVVSSHLWFYQGDLRMGTPAFFYLLFFKKKRLRRVSALQPRDRRAPGLADGRQFPSRGATTPLRCRLSARYPRSLRPLRFRSTRASRPISFPAVPRSAPIS